MSESSIKRWLSENIFFKINEGVIVLWDYMNHVQYEVTNPQFLRLMDFVNGEFVTDSDIDKSILATNVLKTNQPSYRKWGWDWLAEIYHVGTSSSSEFTDTQDNDVTALEYAKSYLKYCEELGETEPEFEIVKGGARIALPPPKIERLAKESLWNSLFARQTCRDFNGEPVDLEILSTALYATFGKMDREDPLEPIGARRFGYRRTSPSAGGLQCVEAYIWVSNVNGLPKGIYHYLAVKHELEVVSPLLPKAQISAYLCNQHWANDLPFSIFMTCRFDKMWWKYPHSRGYRPLLMEVGHFSQTLLLCLTACGLHTWLTGYFHDNNINDFLNLSLPEEQVLFMVGGGYGSGSGYTREDRILMDEWST